MGKVKNKSSSRNLKIVKTLPVQEADVEQINFIDGLWYSQKAEGPTVLWYALKGKSTLG